MIGGRSPSSKGEFRGLAVRERDRADLELSPPLRQGRVLPIPQTETAKTSIKRKKTSREERALGIGGVHEETPISHYPR